MSKGLIMVLLGAMLFDGASVIAATPSDPLVAGFSSPPVTARPRVWWHWMNGNITKDGIRKDLEWMHRVGIGGVQNFDAALATPQVVERRLAYMTSEWKDAFRYAAGLADSLGLELAIAASPGWSETGGPWVTPEDAMKKLVWSEIELVGGRRFEGQLPTPPSAIGPFQDVVRPSRGVIKRELIPDPLNETVAYYADAAVLAYPLAEREPLPTPRYRSMSGEEIDATVLTDGRYAAGAAIPASTAEQVSFVSAEFASVQTIRSATVALQGGATRELRPQLQASTDGRTWKSVADFELVNGVSTTASFAPVSATHFRLMLTPAPKETRQLYPAVPGVVVGSFAANNPTHSYTVCELRLEARAQVDRFEQKAGFSIARDYYALGTPNSEGQGVAPQSIIDLTARMSANGRLAWTPPQGRWKVVRLGYSLTGTTNHPATAEATGLEVDKFDAAAVERYMDTYLDMYADTTGTGLMGAKGLRAIITDSIEVGASNWTGRMIERFRSLRGYDPRPWLPVLTGALVGTRAQSDAFLYDFRRTIADLYTSEHYAQIAKSAHQRGLKVYGEALENGRPSLGDDMAMRRYTDVPMAALWTYPKERGPVSTLLADLRGAASVAHAYGQNVVAAESLTSCNAPWAHAPSDLKPVIDLEFAQGINLPVLHTSVHQPVDDKVPGLSLFFCGQYFTRHETWAEMARPWIDYIARSAFMLQQGRYVADVAYFFGEEGPLTALGLNGPIPDVPAHYGYDFVNADVVLNELSVEKNQLTTASGMRYRVLFLGGTSQRMTLRMLRRLQELVAAGAVVVGDRPNDSPSLADDPAEFKRIADELWSAASAVGTGRILPRGDIESTLASLGVQPDFAPSADGTAILHLHRRVDDTDIYFLNNREDRPQSFEARFRVQGKSAEIWRADTGSIEPVATEADGSVTRVALEMSPHDALFVVFRPSKAAAVKGKAAALRSIATIDGAWTVTFQSGRGAPAAARIEELQSLTENPDTGIKYFSGVAHYSKDIEVPSGASAESVVLDLGKVGDLAEVFVNGEKIDTLWKAPFRAQIGRALRPGKNTLEVRVANLWVNRLIGDAQPGATQIAFTTVATYKADAPLRPAGLIGPVQLLAPVARTTTP